MIQHFRLLLISLWTIILPLSVAAQIPDLAWTKTVGARTEPKGTKVFNVSDYGANPDGTTLNTLAIQKAIDACAASGGGTVTFSPGRYLTGSIYVKAGVNLNIPKRTVLLGSQDINDYPEMDTRVAGLEMRWPSALINILDQKNVMISGDGIVHGQGKVFWDSYWALRRDYEKQGLRWIVDYDCKRPRTLLISESSDVTVKDLTFQQAGFWTIQILYSTQCTVDGVVIQNNIGGHGPSTDGVDIDSSSRILVQNCDIDCNDDNFCLKSGRDADGLRVNRPTEYIVIRDCVSRAGGGLLTCGSETSGGIRYVYAENLKAKGTTVGIRLKSAMNRGGTTEHIYVNNIEMEDVGTVFEATMNWNPAYSYSTLPEEYEGKTLPDHWQKMLEKVDPKAGIPYFNDVYLSNFNVKKSRQMMSVAGSQESLMRNFHFSDIDADVEDFGEITFAKDWTFGNYIKIKARSHEPATVNNSVNVKIPENEAFRQVEFPYQLKTGNTSIVAAAHPEVAFYLPEMAGNLKLGVIVGKESKWLSQFKSKSVEKASNGLIYRYTGEILGKGALDIQIVTIPDTDGIVLEVKGDNLPQDVRLFWSYGGAYGKVLDKKETGSLKPLYCKDNVFSVEESAFTLYYGESMKLRVINMVAPVTSDIRLSDAFDQESPLIFFESGKDTTAPALAATLPLVNGKKEYFCVYKQNDKADYNHFMLPALFNKLSASK
ncbi:DUF4450 domain-containing protein [Dysgonomonas macrotermitis]|uniref:Glycosyl hydrolases family 28 n=1 Tax=Dysgonomonas macrotermitis TaxID=1346286 RepID=A0A1M4TMC1_9BACT|nr:DUF4450 domain-containing protein [Dysgonomonas macrotermitis]SHE45578.1 Glycosyl hydrolases family 28 [Dysgonomonas macrotermitis]